MSYRFSQLSPQVSTRGNSIRIEVRTPWNTPIEGADVQVWRSRLELVSEDLESRQRRLNWYAVLGLALAVGVSAAFWTGVGFTAAHFLK